LACQREFTFNSGASRHSPPKNPIGRPPIAHSCLEAVQLLHLNQPSKSTNHSPDVIHLLHANGLAAQLPNVVLTAPLPHIRCPRISCSGFKSTMEVGGFDEVLQSCCRAGLGQPPAKALELRPQKFPIAPHHPHPGGCCAPTAPGGAGRRRGAAATGAAGWLALCPESVSRCDGEEGEMGWAGSCSCRADGQSCTSWSASIRLHWRTAAWGTVLGPPAHRMFQVSCKGCDGSRLKRGKNGAGCVAGASSSKHATSRAHQPHACCQPARSVAPMACSSRIASANPSPRLQRTCSCSRREQGRFRID